MLHCHKITSNKINIYLCCFLSLLMYSTINFTCLKDPFIPKHIDTIQYWTSQYPCRPTPHQLNHLLPFLFRYFWNFSTFYLPFLFYFFFTLSFHFYNGKFGRVIPMTDGSRMIPRLIHILYHWFISGDQSGEDPNELRLAWITHKIPTPAKSTIHPNSKSQPHKI